MLNYLWGQVDFAELGSHTIGDMSVLVIDSVEDYVQLMKSIFDFASIKEFFQSNKDFKMLFDGMNGGKSDRRSLERPESWTVC